MESKWEVDCKEYPGFKSFKNIKGQQRNNIVGITFRVMFIKKKERKKVFVPKTQLLQLWLKCKSENRTSKKKM